MKKARYVGPSGTGVEVTLPDGRTVHVPQGGELPADAPADLRDALLAQEDWTEVNRSASGESRSEKKED